MAAKIPDPEATPPGALSDKEKTDGSVEAAAGDVGMVGDGGLDVLSMQDLDPALNMKMHLVNNVSHCYCSSRGLCR